MRKTILTTLEFATEKRESAKDSSGSGNPSHPDPPNSSSFVGDVLDTASPGRPGRVLVRWRMPDGAENEQWLPVVRGLALKSGDLVLLHRLANWHEWLVSHAIAAESEHLPSAHPLSDVVEDNKRVEIEGQDEVVLRCGKASITLRRNGRVVIRGAYIESRSEGTNRIKGGHVLIN